MAEFGVQYLEHLARSKDIYRVLHISDYSEKYYWITAINEVIYDPTVRLHNEIQWSSPKGTAMVNCEMSYLDRNGKVHFYDYLFAVPSSGDMSKVDAYKVKYDRVLQIYRVFEDRHSGLDPKDVLWNECVRSRRSQQAGTSSHIAFPFLSWPVPAPLPKNTKARTAEGPASSSSERSGTDTPITPVTPSPERSFPKIDVHNAKLSSTTTSLDLAAVFKKSKGSSTVNEYLNLEEHRSHCALYKRDGEHPTELWQAILAVKQYPNKEGSPKSAEIKKKVVAANVTVQARSRYFDVHRCPAITQGLPGPSPLHKCLSIDGTTGKLQQTVSNSRNLEKTPPQAVAHPFNVIVREGNAECKAYQAIPQPLGKLSQYLRAGTDAEIDSIWLASPLRELRLSFQEVEDLALALWKWHQTCLKTRELRISGVFVPARLGGIEGDIDERSAYLHPTNDMGEGVRKEVPRETNLDRVPFTEPYQKDRKGNGKATIPHHFSHYDEPVYCKSYTPPEVSLWATRQPCKPFRKESREAVLISQAWKLVDPFHYFGPPEHLEVKGPKLRDIVIGLVSKVYKPFGTWMYDRYDLDETVPRSSEEFPGWDSGYQMPQENRALGPQEDRALDTQQIRALESQDNRALDPQDEETIAGDNDDFYRPESGERTDGTATVASRSPDVVERSASNSTGEEAAEELLDEQTGVAPDAAERAISDKAEEEVAGEVLDEQLGTAPGVSEQAVSNSSEEDEAAGEALVEELEPERQTTAPAVIGLDHDQSNSDYLDASFNDEDLVQSTPPSQGRSSMPSDAGNSPSPQRKLPAGINSAMALTAVLAEGGSDEEVRAHLARALQRSPPTNRPYVHNSEDEDSVDHTDTWPKFNRTRTAPNPMLARFAETSTSGGGDYDDLVGTGPPSLAPRHQMLTGGERQRHLHRDARETARAGLGGFPTSSVRGQSNNGRTGSQESSDLCMPTDEERSEIEGLSKTLDQAPHSLSNAALERNLERIQRMRVKAEQGFTPTKESAAKQKSEPEQGHKAAGTSVLNVKETVAPAAEAAAEGPSVESSKDGGEADLDGACECSEPQVVDGWLEYMSERGALENATDEEPPGPASQDLQNTVDDTPIEDDANQIDPSWLEYQEARGQMVRSFDDTLRREEAEGAAHEAAKRRDAQTEKDMLNWLQENAILEAIEQGDIQRERQARAATTAALAVYSDVSEIPPATTPTFTEYFLGTWALRSSTWLRDCRSFFHVAEPEQQC